MTSSTVLPKTGQERTTIPILNGAGVASSAQAAIAQARGLFDAIETVALPDVTEENVLDAWDRGAMALEDAFGPISLLGSVHPDKEVRDASDLALIEESSFLTDLFQNENLYQRVVAFQPRSAAAGQLRKDLLESFQDSGVSLPLPRRKRFKEISDRLTELSQDFARNIRENETRITFTPSEAEGLPPSYLARAPRDEQGNLVLGFDYPEYQPFMMNARSERARKRYYTANTNRGTPANLAVLDEIVALRAEIARLYEVPSYAHYVTRRGMVENPETVGAFLDEVKSVVTEAELRDLAELAATKAAFLAIDPAATRIERWDVSFYRERLREQRYAIDQEQLRRYFPTPATLEWLLDISSTLYGIRFQRVDVARWHDDVIYLDVFDAGDGLLIGGIYLDLYPREGKYKHAAAWPVRGVSTRAERKPISVLVTNFDRVGLTHGELETFLHEFGHVLHGVLSRTEYNQHSGTAVERDFVEAPSQMYEEWGLRMESLARISQHSAGCPPVDESLVDRLNAAKRFGSGIDYGRQHLYAAFDMVLSGASPRPSLQVWREMEGATPMGYLEGTAFPGTFEHIASGYAAGYYGYMWAKVIALDMLSRFGDDVMNPEAGRRFRELILARGGEQDARVLVEKFLGRPVSSEAFFREIRGRTALNG